MTGDRAPPHPHLDALDQWRDGLAHPFSEDGCRMTLGFDPLDGGDQAELLVLLETPAPGPAEDRIVSMDNPTGTSRNLRRAILGSRLDLRRLLIWNTVPWLRSGVSRPLRTGEIAAGVAATASLVARLPRLKAAIVCGRVAGQAAPSLTAAFPEVRLIPAPHPSPIYINTDPSHRGRLDEAFEAAARLLDEPIASGERSI